MKVKGKLVLDFSIILAVMAVLVASAGCFYPKAERVSGELVSDVIYKIDHETIVLQEDVDSRQWIYVDCDYWAGCFMRCDGSSKKCSQLAKDSNFSILSVFMSVFR